MQMGSNTRVQPRAQGTGGQGAVGTLQIRAQLLDNAAGEELEGGDGGRALAVLQRSQQRAHAALAAQAGAQLAQRAHALRLRRAPAML